MTAKIVHALFDDIRLLGGDQYALVEAVRALVKRTVSPVSEEVKYGGILFSSAVPFCGVFAYRQHVSVEFGSGARIVDTLGHLEGTGKDRRHLKLHAMPDIKMKDLAHYLPLALAAAKEAATGAEP